MRLAHLHPVMLPLLFAWGTVSWGGGHGSATTSLTSKETLSVQLDRTTSQVQPMEFELTGTVTDHDDQPIVNASFMVQFLVSNQQTSFSSAHGTTDGAGFYRIVFTALPGALLHDGVASTAFIGVDQTDYETDYRWIQPTTHDASQNVRLHRVKRITAGELTSVTIAADDSVCVNNVQDIPGLGGSFVCRTVRVVAPADGIMWVEAFYSLSGPRPGLEVETVGFDHCCSERMGNPISIPVTAGTEVIANIEVPWGSISQTFVVNTWMAPQ